MMITGFEKWYLAVLILGKAFLWFEIPRCEEEIEALAQAEKYFWEHHVLLKIPPETDENRSCADAIQQVYPFAEAGEATDLSEITKTVSLYHTTKNQITELESLKIELENSIKNYMKTAETGICGKYTVTWKNSTQKRFDSRKCKAENPTAYEKYSKTVNTRVFKIKEIKED